MSRSSDIQISKKAWAVLHFIASHSNSKGFALLTKKQMNRALGSTIGGPGALRHAIYLLQQLNYLIVLPHFAKDGSQTGNCYCLTRTGWEWLRKTEPYLATRLHNKQEAKEA